MWLVSILQLHLIILTLKSWDQWSVSCFVVLSNVVNSFAPDYLLPYIYYAYFSSLLIMHQKPFNMKCVWKKKIKSEKAVEDKNLKKGTFCMALSFLRLFVKTACVRIRRPMTWPFSFDFMPTFMGKAQTRLSFLPNKRLGFQFPNQSIIWPSYEHM